MLHYLKSSGHFTADAVADMNLTRNETLSLFADDLILEISLKVLSMRLMLSALYCGQ